MKKITSIKPSREQWEKVNDIITKEMYRIYRELKESGEISKYLTEEELKELEGRK